MELEPDIHQLTFGREPLPGFPPPNAFLVCGTEASVMIDAGWANDADHQLRAAYLGEVSAPPLREVVITHMHPDHAGGARRLHEDTGAALACHPVERDVIVRDHLGGQDRIASTLTGGETRDLGGLSLQILAAPGHTHGCLAVYVPERGALFTSDTVMGISTTAVGPENGDLAAYQQTLHKLMDVGAKTIYTGHGGPVADPKTRLQALIDHRRQREEELLTQLASGPKTVADLRQAIYVGLPETRHRLAEGQIRSGIDKLAREGAVREEDGRYLLAR